MAIFAAGSIYSGLHFYLTGYYTPDVFAYAYFHVGEIPYQSRYFFQGVNAILFGLFQVNSPDRLALFMPFYFMLWTSIGTLSAYKIMKLFGFKDKVISATLLLSLTVPIYVLLSTDILTEPVALAMTMLGMWCIAKFSKSGGYQYPLLAALCFVAADYTRLDFAVFQYFGFIPFVIAEYRRVRTMPYGLLWRYSHIVGVSLLFIIPAGFFAIYPSNGVVASESSIASVVAATHQLPATINRSAVPSSAISSAPPSGNVPYNVFRFVALGLVFGFNPITGTLFTISFIAAFYAFLRRKGDSLIPFVLGLLGVGTFGSIVMTYSVVPNIGISTAIRYAYDMMPAFFVLIPLLLSRIKGKRPYYAMAGSLMAIILVGSTAYPALLQSNLGGNYPFLHGENFLALDYRVPYAQIRDYFHAHPQRHFIVLAETTSLAANVTTNWRFTPGVSDINVTFYPFKDSLWVCHHFAQFYYYIEPTVNTSTISFYGVKGPIYSTSSFLFLGATCPV